MWELNGTDQYPLAFSSALEYLLNRLFFSLAEVDFPSYRVIVKVNVTLLKGEPVLFGYDLVAIWLVDDAACHVVETGNIQIHFLLEAYVRDVK